MRLRAQFRPTVLGLRENLILRMQNSAHPRTQIPKTVAPLSLPTGRRTMSISATQNTVFTDKVVSAIRSLYPEELADRSWDNVGLLLANIRKSPDQGQPVVLLTNDLTIRVAEEAIRKHASVVVSYHPFLFRPFNSVSLSDPHHRILLRLAQHNIAVYSPHTAVDAAPGGLNDWLADMLVDHGVETRRSVCQPVCEPLPKGFDGAGYGRLVELACPVNLGKIVETYASKLGGLRHVMVARPRGVTTVRTVGICAGSGYDVLKDCGADLLVTGEMTHHSALRLVMLGQCVMTVFHSNSERGFLQERLAPRLLELLREDVNAAQVLLSEEDHDPFEIWDVQKMPAWTADTVSSG